MSVLCRCCVGVMSFRGAKLHILRECAKCFLHLALCQRDTDAQPPAKCKKPIACGLKAEAGRTCAGQDGRPLTSNRPTPPAKRGGRDGSEGDLGRRGAPIGRGAHADHRAEPRPRPRAEPTKGGGPHIKSTEGRLHPPPDSERSERRGGGQGGGGRGQHTRQRCRQNGNKRGRRAERPRWARGENPPPSKAGPTATKPKGTPPTRGADKRGRGPRPRRGFPVEADHDNRARVTPPMTHIRDGQTRRPRGAEIAQKQGKAHSRGRRGHGRAVTPAQEEPRRPRPRPNPAAAAGRSRAKRGGTGTGRRRRRR